MRNKIISHEPVWTKAVDYAVKLLNTSKGSPKILVEQNRNLGDTLHLIPVVRHYRKLHPNAAIILIIGKPYANAWAYNKDVNSIITVPKLNPQKRIALRRRLLQHRNKIKIIAPSIFPYGEVWKELAWSLPNIADQYIKNAGIKTLQPAGGRRLIIELDESDRRWARTFAAKHSLTRKNSIGFEYHSYSHQPPWNMNKFKLLAKELKQKGYKCVSIAGKGEPLIPGTIDARGTSWRRTAALMNHLGVFCGVGSGITMVAAAAEKQPHIVELAVSESITMKSCGYAKSTRVTGTDHQKAAAVVVRLLKLK
jgi:ADP-heptose:LPS heptosyltransferase